MGREESMKHAKWALSTAIVALLLGAGTVTAESLIDGGDVKFLRCGHVHFFPRLRLGPRT